ncbi:hypothetical protein [Streptosporangium sp. NPDC004631]
MAAPDDTLAAIDDVIAWHGSPDAMVWTVAPPNLTLQLNCSALQATTGQRCQEEAARLAVIECAHTHTAPVFLCAAHDSLTFNGEETCRTCSIAGHRCPLVRLPGWTGDFNRLLIDGFASQLSTEEERAYVRQYLESNLDRLLSAGLRGR